MTQVKSHWCGRIVVAVRAYKKAKFRSFLEDLKLSIFTDQSYRWDWDYSLSPLVILSVRFANSRAEIGTDESQWEGIMWACEANQKTVMPPANCNVLSLFSIKTRQVMLRDARNPTSECLNTFYEVSFLRDQIQQSFIEIPLCPTFFPLYFHDCLYSISILFASLDHK